MADIHISHYSFDMQERPPPARHEMLQVLGVGSWEGQDRKDPPSCAADALAEETDNSEETDSDTCLRGKIAQGE